MAKERCDNHCETCPMNGQIYCAVMFARATNLAIPGLIEKVNNLEMEIQELRKPTDAPTVINPLESPFEDIKEL